MAWLAKSALKVHRYFSVPLVLPQNRHPACPGLPWGVPWKQPTCLRQVKGAMTLQNRCEARRAGR